MALAAKRKRVGRGRARNDNDDDVDVDDVDGERVLVLLGRLDPSNCRFRVMVPEGAFNYIGMLHVRFLHFSYCEEANHNHFAGPPRTNYPPLAVPYNPEIEVPAPAVLYVSHERRRSDLRIEPPTTVRRRRTERLETPPLIPFDIMGRGARPAPPPPPPGPAPALPLGRGRGLIVQQIQQQQQAAPFAHQQQQLFDPADFADDEDDEGGDNHERQRRAATPEPRRELQPTEILISFGFQAVNNARTVGSVAGNQYDFSIKGRSVIQIIEQLNVAFDGWMALLGNPFSQANKPRFEITDLNDLEIAAYRAGFMQGMYIPPPEIFCKVQLVLPPCFGIAFDSVETFRMLGFDGADFDKQLSHKGRGWYIGNVMAGYKYVRGIWSGKKEQRTTVIRANRELERDTVGERLLANARKRAHVAYKYIPDVDLNLKPRLVIYPPIFSYIVDVSKYRPPADKVGSLNMLVALTEVMQHLFKSAYGVEDVFRIGGVALSRPVVQGRYTIPSQADCQFMSATFGSIQVANWFAINMDEFIWDVRESNTSRVEIDRRFLSREALARRDVPDMTEAEIIRMREELRNIQPDTYSNSDETGFQQHEMAAYQFYDNRRVVRRDDQDILPVIPEADEAGEAQAVGGAPLPGDGGAVGGHDTDIEFGDQTGDEDDDQAAAAAAAAGAAAAVEDVEAGAEADAVDIPAEAEAEAIDVDAGAEAEAADDPAEAVAVEEPEEQNNPADLQQQQQPAVVVGAQQQQQQQQPAVVVGAQQQPAVVVGPQQQQQQQQQQQPAVVVGPQQQQQQPVVVIPPAPPVVVIPPAPPVVVAVVPQPVAAPAPLTIRVPNPVPRPPESFYHLRTFGETPTCAPPAQGQPPRPNVPFQFDSFYIISLDGEPKDFIHELGGSVCLAGSFVNRGLTADSNPCNAGFRLRNWSKGDRILEFVVYSHTIERYTNRSNNVGLARCTISYRPSRASATATMH